MSATNVLIILLFISTPIFACIDSHHVNVTVNSAAPQKNGLFIASTSFDETTLNKPAIRSRVVTINMANLLRKLTSDQSNTLTLNFFDDAVFEVVRKKQSVNDSGSITWIGALPSSAGSIAVLTIASNTLDGSLSIPNKGLFTVSHQLDGKHLVEEIDRSSIK